MDIPVVLATTPELGVAEVVPVLPGFLEVCTGIPLLIILFGETESEGEDKVLLTYHKLVACA